MTRPRVPTRSRRALTRSWLPSKKRFPPPFPSKHHWLCAHSSVLHTGGRSTRVQRGILFRIAPPLSSPRSKAFSPVISYFTEYEKSRIKDEEFRFKFLTLEEDKEDSVSQSLCALKGESLPSQGSSPTVTSDDSSTQAPRRKAPKPGPGLHRPHAH